MTITVIDIGSNSVSVAKYAATVGAPKRLEKASVRMQLYRRIDENGVFPARVTDELIATLRALLSDVGAGTLPTVGVATSAVRDAHNGAALVDAICDALGVEIRVIDGAEEATLSAEAVAAESTYRDGGVLDLGGGSVQLARLQAGVVTDVYSLPLGSLRLSRRHLAHDPPTAGEVDALRAAVRASLATIPIGTIRSVVGVGGTVRALGKLARIAGAASGRVTLAVLEKIVGKMVRLSPAERVEMQGLSAHRVDTIVPGALIIEEIMRGLKVHSLAVSDAGVRDGLAGRCLARN